MAIIDEKYFKTKNDSPITLRSANVEDSRELIQYSKKIYRTSPYVLVEPDEFEGNQKELEQEITNLRSRLGCLQLLALAEGSIIGHLRFKNNYSLRRIAHRGIFNISIDSDWRNQGVARCLVNTLIHWAKERSNPILKIELIVLEPNLSAISLYQSLGFETEGRIRNEVRLSDQQFADGITMGLFIEKSTY